MGFNFDPSRGPIQATFFKGGCTNVCYNALDRHVKAGNGSRPAIIWEGNDVGDERRVSYEEALLIVSRLVSKAKSLSSRGMSSCENANVEIGGMLTRRVHVQANWLKSTGVKKGDNVLVYMPMVPELPLAMLACARIGAVHSVVFGGFSSESLAQRVLDSK